jgi:hypothetical protein
MKNRALASAVLLGVWFTAAAPVFATNLVVNGDFNGFVGDTNNFNTTPPGWTTLSLSPDTFNSGTNFGGFAWSPSQTGGDFLHALSGESAGQNISGLIVGNTYEFSFEQSISKSVWRTGNGYWRIGLGGTVQNSALMTAPDFGTAASWQWQSMTFVATAETMLLTLTADHYRVNPRDNYSPQTDIAIDGLYFGTPGGRPAAPVADAGGTWVLLLGALAGVVAGRKRAP